MLEEASRRLRSFSPHLSWPEKAKHMTTLNLQMLLCGHGEEFLSMITSRAVAKYHTSLANHNRGAKRMYRTREEIVDQWAREGGKTTKANWFKKSGATGVFNLPATLGSRLATAVQVVLDTVPGPRGSRVRTQERPGSSVKSVLVTTRSPGPPVGGSTAPGQPRDRENVGYAARCKKCHNTKVALGVEEKKVEDAVYLGESSNTLPTRAEQHFVDYRQDMTP